jgi:hypothetical protein
MGIATIAPVLTNIDTTAKFTPGTRYIDDHGNEYIYALGVVSTAAGSWVKLILISDSLATVLLDETEGALGGICGVAMAATVASTYGWYQTVGIAEASFLVSCATNVTLFCSATAGSLDDDGASPTRMHGVWLEDTEPGTATANLTCILAHPHCNKVA